jgi:hypothetical protein
MVSTTEIVSHLSGNLCQAKTLANGSRATTPAISDSFLEEYDDDQEGSIDDDTQPVPDWYSLCMEEIYDELNPNTAFGKEKLHNGITG